MGTVNAEIETFCRLIAAHLGIKVAYMDSTEYAAAVADKAHRALLDAGESMSSAARGTGIARSTLDRKLNSGKGIQALTVRELFDIARLAGTTASELATVYETEAEVEAA